MEPSRDIGQRWRRVRVLGNLSQETVANALGVSRVHLARIEGGGNPFSDKLLDRFCREYAADGHAQELRQYLLEGGPVPPLRYLPRDEGPRVRMLNQVTTPGANRVVLLQPGPARVAEDETVYGAPERLSDAERACAIAYEILNSEQGRALVKQQAEWLGESEAEALTNLVLRKLKQTKETT